MLTEQGGTTWQALDEDRGQLVTWIGASDAGQVIQALAGAPAKAWKKTKLVLSCPDGELQLQDSAAAGKKPGKSLAWKVKPGDYAIEICNLEREDVMVQGVRLTRRK